MTISREICLASRPVGMPAAENFAIANRELAAPGAGEVLVQNKYMSVDPYMRGRMYDRPSYVPPFQIGEALQGGAIGVVVESNAEGLRKGDIVSSMFGWREAFVAPAAALEKLDVPGGIPMESFLGVLGMPGLTAWAGLTQIGKPKSGDVVFVSGAAGAVGSIVAQVAKLKGCTVVASAGSDDKCAWLKSLGIDHVINYREDRFEHIVRKLTGKRGVDVVFEHTGADTWNGSLLSLRRGGRLVTCGSTSGPSSPMNLMQLFQQQYRIYGSFGASIRNVGDGLQKMAIGLTPTIDSEMPLSDFNKAIEKLRSRHVFGKIIIHVAT